MDTQLRVDVYDDLARTQNLPPLEWFVVHAMIPSVLVTAALHWSPAGPAALKEPTYVMVCPGIDPLIGPLPCCPFLPWPGPLPDVFPMLVRMPEPTYPEALRRAGIEGRVVLKALVNTRGRVVPSSILVLRTTDPELSTPAILALSAARFRPARFAGARIEAWVTIAVDFKPPQE
jgi:TonB family protein